ncbi:MAG: HAD hydrolase family protein [Firmicutes bacterium]|nr:HAD hydrolase family protein [Bacillota bacterium]
MPKIGLRNIKTAIALAMVMLINLILTIINPELANNWYSPFFAGIAAAYAMQSKQSSSFKLARIRSFGSLIGGTSGMILILLYEKFLTDTISNVYGDILNMTIFYSIVGLMVIPLIYFLVTTQKTDFIFVALLTYLSVTISSRNFLPVTVFAINRMASTIIGVMIALMINVVDFRFHKNPNILFVTGLDGTILTPLKQLTSYTKYKLNQLISKGASITLSTTRTPASLTQILMDVEFTLPLMIMNGSVVFDLNKETYHHVKSISKHAQKGLDLLLTSEQKNAFVYSITDGILSIYHHPFKHIAEQKFFDERKHDYFQNHVKGKLSIEDDAVFYIIIDRYDEIQKLETKIKSSTFCRDITLNIYPYDTMPRYYFLKINSIHASKAIALKEFLTSHQEHKVVSIGSKSFDIPMMQASDFSYATASAEEEVKAIANFVFEVDNPDVVLKEIHKIYYHKNPIQYLEKRKKSIN